ncbi:MAG: universal stress protein [Adhaeribacter sp.]
MKTLLVPTDFSDNANNALYYAAALASHCEGRLVLIHAIALDVVELPGNPFDLKPDMRLEAYFLAKLENLASKVRVKHGVSLQVDTRVVHGKILEHLNKVVISEQADLVVMGTKGAGNLVKRLMGTNTASYIRQALCPVLAIPVSAWYQDLKKIAYASDFETLETGFLKQLFHFAKPLHLDVCIFNVKSEDQLDLVPDSQILGQIKRAFPDESYSIAQLKGRDVIAGIQSFIKDNHMDILALSVHKPDFLEKLFHSSVSESVAFQTTIPVLALPEKPYRQPQQARRGHSQPQLKH